MKVIETELKDCYIIEPAKFGDERGFFSPCFIQKEFEELGFQGVVQVNRSSSAKGILRGLHHQANPKSQTKIVQVTSGSAMDVVVDMREGSLSYGKHLAVYLSEENGRQLFVPRGFAHGFLSLEDNTIFQYLVDNDYAPEVDGGVLWNDPELGIDWQSMFKEYGIEEPLLSEKDQLLPNLKDKTIKFIYEGDK